jgi:hypothetical protein
MFCGDEPCDMHAPKEKAPPKPRKRAPKAEPAVAEPAPVVVPVPDDPPVPAVNRRADLHAAMRARVKPSASPVAAPSAASDAVMDDAIRALAPILHPDEVRNRREILSRPRTIEVRAAAWRERRRSIA